MRFAFCLSPLVVLAGGPLLARSPSDQGLAQSVAELSANSCYGIAANTIAMPAVDDPEALNKSMKAIERMGLNYGLNDSIIKSLGRPGLSLVSQATMGSKTLEQGEVVLAVGGSLPGCRVIVLSDPTVDITSAVSVQLSQAEWKPIPSMTAVRGGLERRAFFRRDGKGNPYLMNLMTITSPAPDSKLRLFTTTIRIPGSVQLPPGL